MSYRYPDNFVQSLEPEELERLPAFATYEGKAADLQHLTDMLIPTKDIEKVVYVGEREQVFVDMPDGTRRRPWAGCAITEYDPQGRVVVTGYDEPLPPPRGPRAMSTADLGALGFTDDWLTQHAKRLLGETYTPDRPGPSDIRRDVFDRVIAAAMA